MIFCPACQCAHLFDSRWTFNGNEAAPTFYPSLRITGHLGGGKYGMCHSEVTDGKIRFIEDCTHELVNQTVPLVPF